MSAPVTERTRTRARTVTIPAQRSASPRQATGAVPLRGTARKAYAKRDDRLRRLVGGPRPARAAASAGRAQFVLLVMVLLAVGLVATLWLSTAAAADSYRLQDARAAAAALTAQSERLHREVAAMNAAPALAQRAAQLGMVPMADPARLVVAPDGTVTVVGQPKAAAAPAPPVPAAVAGPAPAPTETADAATQTGATQTGATQTGATQTGATQTGATQTGAAQTGAAATPPGATAVPATSAATGGAPGTRPAASSASAAVPTRAATPTRGAVPTPAAPKPTPAAAGRPAAGTGG